MKFIELFAGIGGFSLGFERAGMECVGHCEINPYAQKVLKKHWPDVPLYPDVTKLKGDEFGKVELIAGGFPCQDISTAGKQVGITGKRSSLFNEIIRLSAICNPKWIVLENVANLIFGNNGAWFRYCMGQIAKIGYNAEWEIIRASDVGAPHRRARIWIVVYPNSNRYKCRKKPIVGGIQKIQRNRSSDLCKNVANAKGIYAQGQYEGPREIKLGGSNWWATEPKLGRVAYGVPQRVDRLKCLGNALVPQIAEFIGRRIMEIENDFIS